MTTDNLALNDGTGAEKLVTAEVTHSGDTAHLEIVALAGLSGSEGAWTFAPINGDATNGLLVNLGANNDVLAVGDVAHDSATGSAGPVGIGGYASAAAPSDVSTDGDRVWAWFDPNGSQVVQLAVNGAIVPGDATDGLLVNLGTNNDVTGTVTANLGATDNAVLDSIDAATTAIQTAVEGTLTVGSHAVTNAGTFAVQISDTSFAVADGNALGEGVLIQGDDGTDRKNINVDATTGDVQVDVTNTVTVDLGANNDVINSGTFAVQEDGAALTALQLIDDAVYVDDADWTDSTSKHLLVGGLYQSTPQTITDGDVGPLSLTSDGALRVSGSAGVTEYNEDDATPNPIVGSASLMERDDALSTLTPIEGDWVGMRATAEGALWVQDFNSDAILADTANMDTNLGTIAGAVAAGQMQVDIVADGAGLLTSTNFAAAFGTAGTPDTQVMSVQGIASMTALVVDGSAVTQPVSGTVTSNLGATDNAVLDAIQAAVEIMDDWDETNRAAVNLISGQVGVAGGSGTVSALTQRVVLATDVALPAGTNAIGKLAANTGVDIGDVDVTSIAAGSNLIGNVGLGVRTSGGMTIFRSIDIDESEEEIKATAGQVYSISAFNHTAAPLYLKFYNATAATVVVGTTTPVLTFTVPGNADSDGAGFIWNNDIGFAFGTAITVAATTGIADADTGAPAANACSVNIGYA